MNQFECCVGGVWTRLSDLGHANSIDVDAGQCSVCGKPWAHLYVVANHRTLYEPISAEILLALQGEQDRKARKKALGDWLDSIG